MTGMVGIVIFMLAQASWLTSQAQDVGVRLGASLTELNDEDFPQSIDTRWGLKAGAFGTLWLTERWSVQAEFFYAERGNQQPLNRNDTTYTLRTSYFDLPLLARFQFPEYYIGEPYIILGPYLSFLDNAKLTYEDDNLDIPDAFADLDYGLSGGVGFYLTEHIILDLRVAYGLGEAGEAPEDFQLANESLLPDYSQQQNIAFMASLGYRFTIYKDRNPKF